MEPQVARHVGGRAVIEGGLQPGDRVILTNLEVLYDGIEVTSEDGPPHGKAD